MTADARYAIVRANQQAEKPWLSGWCNPANPLDSHQRCIHHPRRDGKPCSCEREGCPCAPVDEVPAVPAGRRITDHAVEVMKPAAYRTPAWYEARRTSVSASEIAAILGLSPWTSAFDLWWAKRTGDSGSAETKEQKRGRRFEALVLEDFTDEHEELHVQSAGLCVNIERPWQACTPDALAFERIRLDSGEWAAPEAEVDPVATIEAKTAGGRQGWGEPGTDGIPVYYRTQVLWQMDTLGISTAFIPVRFGFDYAEYVVEYHEADVALMRQAAFDFLASVREDRMPDIDAHTATARRLKRLHPSVLDGEVEVPAAAVAQYHAAKRLRDAASARMRLAENRIRHTLGDFQVATVDGRKVASRSVYDVKARTQTISAHTVNRLNISKPKSQERNLSHD